MEGEIIKMETAMHFLELAGILLASGMILTALALVLSDIK